MVSYKATDCLTYVIQHDRGWDENAAGGNTRDADWYGINQYFLLQLDDCWSAGLRFEWFRDEDGQRVSAGGGLPADYFGMTLGFNYTPNVCWTVRPEFRWDWVDTNGVTPFNDSGSGNQFLLAVDAIYRF